MAAFALAATLPTGDPDTYWPLASGAWMIEHRAILRADIFSSTVSGQPYALGEWLGEVALSVVFSAGGWAGIAIVRGLLVAIAAFFLVRLSRRRGAPLIAALLVVMWAVAFSKTRWVDRPAIFTLVLFPVTLDLLYRARDGSRRALLAIPPPLLLWTNLHGGYVIGLALVLAFTVEAAAVRRRDAVPLLATLVAGVLVSFLDPETFGLAGAAAHAFVPPRFISEEAPPNVLDPTGLLFAAFVLATFVVAIFSGGELLDALLLIPLLWLALSAQRHLAFFVFAATPFIAAGAARAYAQMRPHRTAFRPPPRAVSVVLGLAMLVLAGASALGAPRGPDERAFPAAAVPALRAGSGTLLNEYDWAGSSSTASPSARSSSTAGCSRSTRRSLAITVTLSNSARDGARFLLNTTCVRSS